MENGVVNKVFFNTCTTIIISNRTHAPKCDSKLLLSVSLEKKKIIQP